MSFSLIISLFFSILLVTATKLNFTSRISALLSAITNPVNRPIAYLRQQENEFIAFVPQIPSLTFENNVLKKENSLLKIEVKKLTDLIADQNQLNNLTNHKWQIQPVKLVSLDNLITFTSLNFDNIRPGQPVATGNSLVGLVKSVEPPIIKVIALTSPEVKISVQLDTGAKGNLSYKDNETRVVNLDSNSTFNSKTTVFTLPSSLMPENLIIGQIDKIVSNQANPTQEATITLDQEIGKAHQFYIITKP